MLDIEATAWESYIYFAIILLVVLPIGIYYIERRYRSTSSSQLLSIPPSTEIISLRIYPIKSCRGIELSSAKLLKTGLDLDRQWMFIDAKERKFQTIRQISRMTLINTAIDRQADELVVSIAAEHMGGRRVELRVPAHPTPAWLEQNTVLRDGEIWGEVVDAYEYREELTKPFSDFLGKDVRLLLKGPTQRVLRGNGNPKLLGRTEGTKFADLAPVQVANIRSLEELNQRLTQQGEDAITTERFRPNIIVKGSDAWNEDIWKTVRISPRASQQAEKLKQAGSVVLDVMARCARCQVPNVHPDTAEKNKKQPWNTLMSYRRVDKGITFKPCFGMLCAPRAEREIKVGDRFEITEVTADHYYIKGM